MKPAVKIAEAKRIANGIVDHTIAARRGRVSLDFVVYRVLNVNLGLLSMKKVELRKENRTSWQERAQRKR